MCSNDCNLQLQLLTNSITIGTLSVPTRGSPSHLRITTTVTPVESGKTVNTSANTQKKLDQAWQEIKTFYENKIFQDPIERFCGSIIADQLDRINDKCKKFSETTFETTKKKKTERTKINTYYNQKKTKILSLCAKISSDTQMAQNYEIKDILKVLYVLLESTTREQYEGRHTELHQTYTRARTLLQTLSRNSETSMHNFEIEEYYESSERTRFLLDRGLAAPISINCGEHTWKESDSYRIHQLPTSLAILIEDWHHKIFNSRQSYDYYTFDCLRDIDPSELVVFRRKRPLCKQSIKHTYLVLRYFNQCRGWYQGYV